MERNYDRARVANELDRREFWKAVFMQSYLQHGVLSAAKCDADEALKIFEQKFGTGPV